MIKIVPCLAAVALINCLTLFLGFKLFKHSGMSVFPVVLSLFNNYLAIAASHSFTYAFIFRPPLSLQLSSSIMSKNIRPHYLFLALILLPLHFYLSQTKSWKIFIFLFFVITNFSWVVLNKYYISFKHQRFSDFLIYWLLQSALFLIGLTSGNFSWDFVHPVSTLTAVIWAAPNYDGIILSYLDSLVSSCDLILTYIMPIAWRKIKGFFSEFFGVGNRIVVWGPVLFQIFFSVSTCSYQMSAMVLLVLSLISSLALLSGGYSSGFGILTVVLKEWILISCIHIVFVDKSWLEFTTSFLNIGACFILLPLIGG